MNSAFNIIKQSSLSFTLTPIGIRELFYIDNAPCDIYSISEDRVYEIEIAQNSPISKELLKDLIHSRHANLFVEDHNFIKIVELQNENLRTITRSLSIGNPLNKGRKHLNLLSINLKYLYNDPTNDELLNLQYQSVKNLCSFLLKNQSYIKDLYKHFIKQKHHYIYSQPLMASVFLIGILKHSRIYSDKEIESLFITSYFKDIGMSAVPKSKYAQDKLSLEDKKLLAEHPRLSKEILAGRIPLGPSYLNIIANHHHFSLMNLNTKILDEEEEEIVSGFETMIIAITDIITAMISERPYRAATTVFEALDLVKLLMAHKYPQEFKLLVLYFRLFFTNNKEES